MSSNEHECRLCTESFETEEELNEHIAAEHPEQGMA
jgi:hypothetical protein